MFALDEDIEVVVAFLPKGGWPGLPARHLIGVFLISSSEPAGDTLFENLHGKGEIPHARFADEEMEVLGHNHIAPDVELIFLSDLFENFEKQITPTGGGEKGLTVVTPAG